MTRRDMFGSIAAPTLVDMPAAKKSLLWFKGETAVECSSTKRPEWHWARRGDVFIRMDRVSSIETVDHSGSCCVVVDNSAIILHPDSFARFKKQWAAYWETEE